MVQIGCRCPMHLQDIFLHHVRGFKAQEVPADWLEQLMVVGSLRGGSSGGDCKGKGKGKGKMQAAAADEDAAWEEQLERAPQASFRAAGSTGSSSSSGGSSSSEGAGQVASSRRASSRACRPPPGGAGASGTNYSW
jgi:hypothetical protein